MHCGTAFACDLLLSWGFPSWVLLQMLHRNAYDRHCPMLMWNMNLHSWAHFPAQPYPILSLEGGACCLELWWSSVLSGCSASDWGGGMGLGHQVLPNCPREPFPPPATNLKLPPSPTMPWHNSLGWIEVSVFYMSSFVMLWAFGALTSSSCRQLELYPKT